MNHEEYVRKVLSSRNLNGTLRSRESNTVEFKESFNKGNTPQVCENNGSILQQSWRLYHLWSKR